MRSFRWATIGQYEPMWDGFKCIAFKDGDKITLQSKSGKPPGRYFPDVVEALGRVGAKKFVLDDEIVIPVRFRLSFDQLLIRIHPDESRVRKLAEEHPAVFVLFNLLSNPRGKSFLDVPLSQRRSALVGFAKQFLADRESIRLSPATLDPKLAGSGSARRSPISTAWWRSGLTSGMHRNARRSGTGGSCADVAGPGWTDRRIAEAFDSRTRTVEKLRERLVTAGFEQTLDGKPPTDPASFLIISQLTG